MRDLNPVRALGWETDIGDVKKTLHSSDDNNQIVSYTATKIKDEELLMSVDNKSILKEALQEAYRRLAPYSEQYEVDFRRYLIMLEYVARIPDSLSKQILDVGTGIGILPLALRIARYRANGIDYFIFPETENVMFGRPDIRNLKRVWDNAGLSIEKYDVTSSLPKNLYETADILISDATIEHLKDPRTFLLNCRALLASGGYFILSTPNLGTLLKRIRFLFGKSPNWPIADFFKDGGSFTGHWREYTATELSYMCAAAGFEVLHTETRNALSPWKKGVSIRKNARAFIARLARCIPSAQELHYVLSRKP